jgi:hypothetical protein
VYASEVKEIDDYLEELSDIYAHDQYRLLSIGSVIDRLLDIRNMTPDIILDGDEMKKYFGKKIEK